MVQQEYVVRPHRGTAYRFVIEIPDDPIVASRRGKSLALDAAWAKTVLDQFIDDNKDYESLVTYFAGYLRSLKYLGVVSAVYYNVIPREDPPAEPATRKEAEDPQPLWTAWQQVRGSGP
ncbi:MAG: hypothetical protein KA967_00030 [Methanoculleus sp.]|nr:hypothetical protein [Methanoculleus sp.]